uniref:Uncharacterized protein n=1 Tax=Panagrolaimus davidi TaxID=227884 RepID=A0A914PCZ6_9BILA
MAKTPSKKVKFSSLNKGAKKDTRTYIYDFKDDKYPDIAPILNAFRHFWYQSTADRNKSKGLRNEKKMLAYLVAMIQSIPIPEATSLLIWQSAEIITAFVTKDDGTLLNDDQQIKKFCDLVLEKEAKVVCGLIYKENNPKPIYYSNQKRQVMFLNVIRWNSGRYGVATRMNVFWPKKTYFCVICKSDYDSKKKSSISLLAEM